MVALVGCLVALAVLLPLALRTPAAPVAAAAAATAAPATTAPAVPAAATPGDVPVVRPTDRPLRVLFVGDSLMWGSFASDESLTYRERISTALGAGGPVDAVSVARPGLRAAKAAVALQKQQGPFDLVFVEIGANDSVSITPAQFGADYADLLDQVRLLAPQAGLVCVGVWNGIDEATPFDRELRPVCAEHQGVVVPMTGLYTDETLRGPEGSVLPDGTVRDQFHPNDLGHEAIAAAVLDVVDH
ncbi:SGNH/GDSL hydrolase family protein [Modestobacter sp. I12A-02662]|uniref:SGNH/GDSL hydrolase family protein n=1 Tax=Modestobacter sp. I12A-02662 TaxID=1730496 RepID=UPI0034DF524A